MFKPGDRVVCVKLGYHYTINIVVDGIYTIKEILYPGGYLNLCEFEEYYNVKSFVLLKENRKQKLEKICLTQEIK